MNFHEGSIPFTADIVELPGKNLCFRESHLVKTLPQKAMLELSVVRTGCSLAPRHPDQSRPLFDNHGLARPETVAMTERATRLKKLIPALHLADQIDGLIHPAGNTGPILR